MKMALTLVALAAFGLTAVAQDPVTPAEQEFLKNGPKLYTMADALKKSEETGLPVACWMGRHLFADPGARAFSKRMAATTIQAAMDSDGEEGKIDPRTGKAIPTLRLKFSDNGYKSQDALYIPLARFNEPGITEKVLATMRGGK